MSTLVEPASAFQWVARADFGCSGRVGVDATNHDDAAGIGTKDLQGVGAAKREHAAQVVIDQEVVRRRDEVGQRGRARIDERDQVARSVEVDHFPATNLGVNRTPPKMMSGKAGEAGEDRDDRPPRKRPAINNVEVGDFVVVDDQACAGNAEEPDHIVVRGCRQRITAVAAGNERVRTSNRTDVGRGTHVEVEDVIGTGVGTSRSIDDPVMEPDDREWSPATIPPVSPRNDSVNVLGPLLTVTAPILMASGPYSANVLASAKLAMLTVPAKRALSPMTW